MIAYHVVFGTYGFWLPNDPRGSWSTYVGSREIYQFGPATKIDVRRSVAAKRHDRRLRESAKHALTFAPALLDGRQAQAVGNGFAQAILESDYVISACSILPDHIHVVLNAHRHKWSLMMAHLKGRATQQLYAEKLWPRNRPLWARSGWCVYLDDVDDVSRAIRYVENNPLKEGKSRQKWSFVKPLR